MSSTKKGNDAIDLNKPHEENEIQLKGIFGFAIGLVLLIVITFGLMSAFLGSLRDYWHETADPANPMVMSGKDRLPPEPRLQSAPGFGVDSEHGRVNLELREPAAEYKELRKQWEDIWKHGEKDEKSGAVIMLPINDAKAKFLAQNVKANSGADAERFYQKSRELITDSSSGRVASEMRR